MVSALSATSILISVLALITSIVALGITLGMKWSSHKIEFKPLLTSPITEEQEETPEDQNDEEVLRNALNLQRKKKKEIDPLLDITETANF